jgi:hypothetical protein
VREPTDEKWPPASVTIAQVVLDYLRIRDNTQNRKYLYSERSFISTESTPSMLRENDSGQYFQQSLGSDRDHRGVVIGIICNSNACIPSSVNPIGCFGHKTLRYNSKEKKYMTPSGSRYGLGYLLTKTPKDEIY